jgi:hypothetical protein
LKTSIRQYLLERIESEWRSLPSEYQPWGIWIREYAPIQNDVTHGVGYKKVPQNVWFLTKDGISERSIWEFERFRTVQFEQPWCKRMFHEPLALQSKRTFEIGLTAFAQYEDTLNAYLEFTWGGLWGRGWRMTFDENGTLINSKDLWIS